MKIIKGASRAETHWTARQLVEYMEDGTVDFNIDIQRGYVWKKNDRRSEFIRTLILDNSVPALYFNKIDDKYGGVDGKQRAMTLMKYMNDEFALSDLDIFTVENDEGAAEEVDINGLKFSQLPEIFQNAIKDYNFMICYTENADQSQEADMFYALNNGQSLAAATMNRVKAKSKKQIIRLGKHKLFTDALSKTALEGHVNDDMVAKAHAILNDKEVSTDAKWIRPYMKTADITKDDEELLNKIFDRIYNIHSMIEDSKIAKRVYGRTHMISIIPTIAESLDDGHTDKQMMEWFVNFFCGKKSPTISKPYNEAAGRGTGKNSAIKARLEAIRKDYDKYFSVIKNFPKAS
jgi:hypothetical protein